jgi:hypothetical protein
MILFLEKYELIYNNIKIETEIKIRWIFKYYKDDVVRELKGFNVWKVKDWEKLKTKMLKE